MLPRWWGGGAVVGWFKKYLKSNHKLQIWIVERVNIFNVWHVKSKGLLILKLFLIKYQKVFLTFYPKSKNYQNYRSIYSSMNIFLRGISDSQRYFFPFSAFLKCLLLFLKDIDTQFDHSCDLSMCMFIDANIKQLY